MTYQILYEGNPARDDVLTLSKGIADYAKQRTSHKPIEMFAFFVRDMANVIKGGCNGMMYYGCLYIDQLWVDEALRSQGYGTRLMLAAENLGKEKLCLFSTVNTMDWEALEFYKKLGYQVELERRGYLKNSILYLLRKGLL